MKKVNDYYSDNRQFINNVRVALSAESGLTLKVEEIEDYSITEKNPNGKRSHRDILLKQSSPSRKRRSMLIYRCSILVVKLAIVM